MTKRHFEAFADVIASLDLPRQERLNMARVVAVVARMFNARFDQDRFYRACGLE